MTEERVERRLAAILAADVAGYSRLMGEDETGTLVRLRAHRRELIDPKIAEHKGRIVKTTGDGLLIEFPSVVEAVTCAIAVQRATAERNASVPEDQRIEFRVGINLGDVIVEDSDIYGDGVNVAARLEALADPGGICISGTVRDHIGDRLGSAFDDLGEQNLKNIARPVRVYRVVGPASHETVSTVKLTPALTLPDKPSIAVLPFQNMSGDPEQEYFANGMVEDITTALSKIRWFFVIARNSAFAYKGPAVDIKQVSRELGVRYILEGSVRKGGTRLRITAQLVEAATGNHLWAERYDRELADIFIVQDEITERVVAAIEPELYAAESERTRQKLPESLDAWECVIRALSALSQSTGEGVAEAERLCRHSISIAPDYAKAHSLLAWALLRSATWSSAIKPVLSDAAAEADTALRLDDRDAWGHLAKGIVLWRNHKLPEGVRAFRHALELNPNFALAHAYLGHVLADSGVPEEAIESAEHALRLSPRDRLVELRVSIATAHAHFTAERYTEAVVWTRRITERFPAHPWGHMLLSATAAMLGDMQTASEALTTTRRIVPSFSLALLTENTSFSRELREPLYQALRRAGTPET